MAAFHPIGRSFSPGRAISHGFAAVRLAVGPMWIAGLLMGIADGCNAPTQFMPPLPFGDDAETSSRLWQPSAWKAGAHGGSALPSEFTAWVVGIALVTVLIALAVGVALFLFGAWVQAGSIRLHMNILERASDSVSPLFSGRDRIWAMAGWKLLASLVVFAAFVVSALPGAIVAGVGYARESDAWFIAGLVGAGLLAVPAVCFAAFGVFLGDCAVVVEGAGPVGALRRAWALARGNRFPLLWFAFVCFLVQAASVLGIVVCCVGAFFTIPLAIAIVGFAKTESFLLFTRGPAAAAGWALWQEGGAGAAGAAGAHARAPMPGWERQAPSVAVAPSGPVHGIEHQTPPIAAPPREPMGGWEREALPAATPPPRDPFYRPPPSREPVSEPGPGAAAPQVPAVPPVQSVPSAPSVPHPALAPPAPPAPMRGWMPEPPSGATPAPPYVPPGWTPINPSEPPDPDTPSGAPPGRKRDR